jgi:hypothetical protein
MGLGGHTQQALDLAGAAVRALHRFIPENQLLKGVLAFLAGILVQGHRTLPQ